MMHHVFYNIETLEIIMLPIRENPTIGTALLTMLDLFDSLVHWEYRGQEMVK